MVIKHTNPCGVASKANALEAFSAARACDPLSAFGGIISIGAEIDAELAQTILEQFVEIVVCKSITKEALEVFAKKKNVRLIQCDFAKLAVEQAKESVQIKQFGSDYLLQDLDNELAKVSTMECVTQAKPSERQLKDLQFAWCVCKHTKSNAIIIAKNAQAIGVGAGQMSRVDAAELAIKRAKAHGHEIEGAVAASDAFLPFPDTLEVLNEAGVVALAQPGGSIKDKDVIASADQRNVVMLATGQRHFRH